MPVDNFGFAVTYFAALSDKITRSSAIAERPRDSLYQLKSCQLLQNLYEKSHLERLSISK